MAAPRSTTVADAAALALGPLLIALLVGSLVFFLAEVLYAGQYSFRLNWTLGFYVVGCVLVARIAIELDAARSHLYGVILASAAYLALVQFVEYPRDTVAAHFGWLINLGLLAVVWWSAQKLTWDCTFIDEQREADDRSVLEAALGERPMSTAPTDPTPHRDWWDRWTAYQAARAKQPHTPGVWVVYFSLAALPLFGLGGAVLPASEPERRNYGLWLLTVYVASGLALLLLTTFLGLRRYLRQRGVNMPATLTGAWAGLGLGLILTLLVLGAFLPRPTTDHPFFQIMAANSPERQASDYAPLREGGTKGEGRQGTQADSTGTQPGDADNPKQQPGDQETEGAGDGGSGKGSGKSADKAGGEQGEPRAGSGQSAGEQGQGGRQGEPKSGRGQPQSRQGERRSSANASSPALNAVGQVAGWLKWLVFAVLIVVVIGVVVYLLVRHLAHFTDWAQRWLDAWQRWWASWFGPREATMATPTEAVAPAPVPQRSFAEYRNPFAAGPPQRSPVVLVRYSFAALEAWAAERATSREPNETPLEFAQRLTPAELATSAKQLAQLVGRLAYAPGPLPANTLAVLERFWDVLTDTPVAAEATER
jgi:hypothetical protein